MSLTNPTTLDEYFDTTGVDEELRPKYRKWLQRIVKRMIPKRVWGYDKFYAKSLVDISYEKGYCQALSDMSDRIKKM